LRRRLGFIEVTLSGYGDGSLVRDVVIPIVSAKFVKQGEFKYEGLLGTGFLIGDGSRLLTAAHVLQSDCVAVGLQVVGGEWRSMGLVNCKIHPVLDICLCETQLAKPQESWLHISSVPQHASCSYSLWGYPDDVVYDHGVISEDGLALQNPDLVYSAGHIRRRFSGSVPSLKGSEFYELSQVAGSGCSGAPVILHQSGNWKVIGVYSGERSIVAVDKATKEIGYATRLDGASVWLKENGVAVQ
jgi:hypothetical protein